MANSITLSTALVSDIQSKINAGTATAEEVVLYTKGLNQLQTGNDFQSVVIGLAQSAVDAIDSSNAQFQEDSSNALSTFNQTFNSTATGIAHSASNAISAINTAKDVLVATDAEITTTINSLPQIGAITSSIYYETRHDRDVNGWDGVHPLPIIFKPTTAYGSKGNITLDHPYKTPMCIMSTTGHIAKQRNFYLLDHNFQVMDQVSLAVDQYQLGTAGVHYMGANGVPTRYLDYGLRHSYGFEDETHPSSGNQNNFAMTGYISGTYGHGRYIGFPNAYQGMNPGFMQTYNQTGCNQGQVQPGYLAVIVNDTRRDWLMSRHWTGNYLWLMSSKSPYYATYSRMGRIHRKEQSNYWTTNEASDWTYATNLTKYGSNDYTGDSLYHDRMRFSTYVNTGAGLISYNHTTRKFVYIDVDTPGAYRWKPKLFQVNSGYDLRDIALGKQALTTYDQDPTTTGIMTLLIDGQNCPKEQADTGASAVADLGSYDRYQGNVVLCDNDTLVYQISYDNARNITRYIRTTKNNQGTEYEFSQQLTLSRSNGLGSTDYGMASHVVSNDGKYVCLFDSYYYYGAGINLCLVRVADGAMLYAQYGDTSRGFNVIPQKHNTFIFNRSISSDSSNMWNPADCEFLFANFADGTNVSTQIFATSDHAEYNYTKGIQQALNGLDSTRNFTMTNIYKPYGFMFDYFDSNGNRKSTYDKNFNLIT